MEQTTHSRRYRQLERIAHDARRQALTRHLYDLGPRCVFFALLEIARGGDLDAVLASYWQMPADLPRRMVCDNLPTRCTAHLDDGGRA